MGLKDLALILWMKWQWNNIMPILKCNYFLLDWLQNKKWHPFSWWWRCRKGCQDYILFQNTPHLLGISFLIGKTVCAALKKLLVFGFLKTKDCELPFLRSVKWKKWFNIFWYGVLMLKYISIQVYDYWSKIGTDRC